MQSMSVYFDEDAEVDPATVQSVCRNSGDGDDRAGGNKGLRGAARLHTIRDLQLEAGRVALPPGLGDALSIAGR